MFDILKNGTIYVTRGDSFDVTLYINMGTDISPIRYKLTENTTSEVYLALMEPNQPFENAILKKKFTYKDVNENGDVVIHFQSKDTQCLIPGKYFYQIKLRIFPDGGEEQINTIIPKTQFFIEE